MDTSSECYICKTVFKELQTLDRDAATQVKIILDVLISSTVHACRNNGLTVCELHHGHRCESLVP